MQVIPKCIQNLKILVHLHKNTNLLDHNKMSLELGVGLFCLAIANVPIYWRFSIVLLLFVKVGDFMGFSTDLGSKHMWQNGVI
jgi:hypothetical protein